MSISKSCVVVLFWILSTLLLSLHFITNAYVENIFNMGIPVFAFQDRGYRFHLWLGKQKSHMPCCQKTKTLNRSDIVTNSIKTLEMVHIKNKRKNTLKKVSGLLRFGVGRGATLKFCLLGKSLQPYPSPNPVTSRVTSSQNLSFGCFLSCSLLL